MEGQKVQSAFKLMGTILGAIILIVGLGLIVYAIIYPSALGLIFFGIVGAVIGAIVIYAARREG
jgi:F0F1-type ATP synthase assembly protein I